MQYAPGTQVSIPSEFFEGEFTKPMTQCVIVGPSPVVMEDGLNKYDHCHMVYRVSDGALIHVSEDFIFEAKKDEPEPWVSVTYHNEVTDLYSLTLRKDGVETGGLLPGWALPYLGVMGEPHEIVGYTFKMEPSKFD